jgi:hypothetical protein
MITKCPVCDADLKSAPERAGMQDAFELECPACGSFTMTGTLLGVLPGWRAKDSLASAKLSHALRRAQLRDEAVQLSTYTAKSVLELPLPRPSEQADLMVRWLAEHLPGPGETLWVEPRTHSSIVGASSPKGFGLVVDHLFEVGLLRGTQSKTLNEPGRAHATLSMRGWEYYEQLRRGASNQRKAFMAMKYGSPDLDAVVRDVFKPCVEATGFALRRLDDEPRAGLIDDRLRVEIQSSDFLIADLSHDNLGAYWEAGYAEGLGKPVIYTCERSKFDTAKTHFDTNHHLTVIWDALSPADAGVQLKATIRATLPHLARQRDDP